MKMFYPVIFTKESNGISTVVPDLDGCFSEGEDFTQAYTNTQDAIGLYLEDLKEFPKATAADQIKVDNKDQFMCVVEFDDTEYLKRNRTKAIKKTLTIPEWLNEKAESAHINFSGVLQEALKQRLNIK